MKTKIILIVSIVLAVALFTGVYFLYDSLSGDYVPDNLAEGNAETNASEEAVDYSAPDFTVTDSEGREVNLSDYFGKPIVLNFWASWCSPCKSEMPHFEAAYKANPDIQFLMVNMTSGDTQADANALIKEEGYTFPVLYDTMGDAAYTYGASSLPVTFFIDKDSNLVTYAVGMLSAENLEKGMELITQ